MNKIILVDVDGVLLNWREAFMRFMQNRGFPTRSEFETEYLLSEYYVMSDDEFHEQVEIFNGGRWEFGTLKPELGAVEGIAALSELGYRFIAISACTSGKQTFVLRRANLYNIFGDVFNEVHCLDLKNGKKSHLASHEPTFWIEDKMVCALEGVDAGHTCILIDKIWNKNQHNDQIEKCQDWVAVVAYINSVLDNEN